MVVLMYHHGVEQIALSRDQSKQTCSKDRTAMYACRNSLPFELSLICTALLYTRMSAELMMVRKVLAAGIQDNPNSDLGTS